LNMEQRAHVLKFKWGTSRGRDTYGYAICTLYVDGERAASCNGGNYDMKGVSLAGWVERHYASRLLRLRKSQFPRKHMNGEKQKPGFYGLSYHDPNWKPSDECLKQEKAGKSLGLRRYQEFYAESSRIPTKLHRVPQIAGMCGMSSVERIMNAIGLQLRYVDEGIYEVYDKRAGAK